MTHLDTLRHLELDPPSLGRCSSTQGRFEPSLGSRTLGRAERPAPASLSEAPLGCSDSERSYNALVVHPISIGSWGAASVQLALATPEGAPAPGRDRKDLDASSDVARGVSKGE
jgi:hypothetical protein